ncbi:hypothetical protein Q5H93_02975 [Hymenobacter sp. ASUV-10]|uniref:SH3 domain-containing protein n=1 Tax=Hymenobacter aranciens TaxID=3063996 RepID=A0ABT9B5Y9_9BACT|nr:hypothetical protein [Hymenobacter sp. ASUV-10]MDO7873682.1 hypothetical protein [Hymenobacter sp. ASUV-10]
MATAYKLGTNTRFRGAAVYPKGSGVRVRRLTAAGQPDMREAGVLRSASRPAALGTGTGRQLVPATGTGPGWLEVTDSKGKAGWVRYDLLGPKPVDAFKSNEGEALVKAYVQNEITLGKVLARNRVMLDLMGKRISGPNTDSILNEQKRLELRMKDRQRRLMASKDVIKVTSFIDPLHLVFKPAAIRRWYGVGVQGVGAIPFAAWAIGVGVVAGIALVSSITWSMAAKHYTTDAKASIEDFGKAETVQAWLNGLPPEQRKAAEAELVEVGQNLMDKGAAAAVTENDKKETGVVGQFADLIKWGGVVFLAAKVLL